MENNLSHGISEENIDEFVSEMRDLLQKYGAHQDKTGFELKTHNLNLSAENVSNCPPACRHVRTICDINHKNCTVQYYCDCSS